MPYILCQMLHLSWNGADAIFSPGGECDRVKFMHNMCTRCTHVFSKCACVLVLIYSILTGIY